MWGFKRHLDPEKANLIFSLITDKEMSKKFNPNSNSPKGFDQTFLSTVVYEIISNKWLEHDSYLCSFFTNSKPFPTKRIGNCFVGGIGSCNETALFYTCPKECRPKNHLNWIFC